MPLTVSPFIHLPTSTTLPYTYKPMPSTLPPSATGVTSATPATPTNDPEARGVSSTAETENKPRYVVSQSGHAAHPDDIIASCRALQAHLAGLQADAERELRELDERIRARELAEKRRVAPGWLDSDARLLEPERAGGAVGAGVGAGEEGGPVDLMSGDVAGVGEGGAGASVGEQLMGLSLGLGGQGLAGPGAVEMAAPDDQGAELDRAFGSLPTRPK